jgi:hypothetical protein
MAGYDFLAHNISTLVNVITAQFKTKYLIGLIYLTPFTKFHFSRQKKMHKPSYKETPA